MNEHTDMQPCPELTSDTPDMISAGAPAIGRPGEQIPWVFEPGAIPLDAPVYVYGVGSCGKRWLQQLEADGRHRVAGLADTFVTGTLNGLRILDPDALARTVLTDGGSVLVASSAWATIVDRLLASGVTRLFNGSRVAAHGHVRRNGRDWPRRPESGPGGRSHDGSRREGSGGDSHPPGIETPIRDLQVTRPDLIERFILELTDQCSFRCLYCHQNVPGFTPRHTMSDELLDDLVGFLTRHQLQVTVDLTGAGDMTMAPRWRERCEAMLDAGVRLTATVNLARPLAPEEMKTFSRFSVLAVSCDSIDPDVFRSIRRSMDIRTVVYNMMAIRAEGLLQGGSEPSLMITATYSAEMVSGIDRLAAFAIAAGARSFGIQDLVEHTATPHNVRSVWTLTGETAAEAVHRTRRALDLLDRHGVSVSLQPEFLERLDQLERSAMGDGHAPAKVDCGRDITYMEPMRPGLTRDCTDPWTFVQVLGDGTVRPCCFTPVVLGQADRGQTLEELQNGEPARKLRENLLTGALDAYCAVCNFRRQVPIAEFHARVRALVERPERPPAIA